MRNPVRSERDAFFIAVGSAVVLGVSVALGALIAPLVGVALFVGAIAGALFWEIATTDPDRPHPLREAAEAGGNARFGPPRVLVVANRTLVSEKLGPCFVDDLQFLEGFLPVSCKIVRFGGGFAELRRIDVLDQ